MTRSSLRRTGALLAAALTLVATASAATLRVPADYPTITGAVQAAAAGDLVLVSNGTYAGGIPLRSQVTVRGESRDGVVVQGASGGPQWGFDFYDFNGAPRGLVGAVVESLTIRGFDRAVRFADNFTQQAPRARSLTLRGLRVENCGEGFFLSWNATPSGLLVVNNEIRGTVSGAAVTLVRAEEDVRVTGNRIDGAFYGVDVSTYGRPTLDHNVITGSLNSGVNVSASSEARVFHNTIAGGNTGIAVGSEQGEVHSNIVAGTLTAVTASPFSPTFRHNVYWNNVAQGNPLSPTDTVADPRFLADDSYRLAPTSAAIDAGDPDAPYALEPDYNGLRADAGAYGNTPLATPSAPNIAVATGTIIPAAGVGAFAGTDVVVQNTGTTRLDLRSLSISGSTPGAFAVEDGAPDAVPAGGSVTLRVRLATDDQGTYTGTLRIETNDPDTPVVQVPLALRRVARLHVDPSADATADDVGARWSDAYASLSDALGYANGLSGQVALWITEGLFRPTGNARQATFALRRGVSLLGGFSGTEDSEDRDPALSPTVLSGDLGTPGDPADNALHVVTVLPTGDDAPVRIDGLTIRDGRADAGDGGPDSNGGGLASEYASDPLALTITRTRFEANFGRGGGAFCNNCVVQVTDAVFQNNTAQFGGAGMDLVQSEATIQRTLFQANRSADGAGGLQLGTTPYSITDSQFIDNQTGGYGAGLYAGGASGVVQRVVFEQNRAIGQFTQGGGAHLDGGPEHVARLVDVDFFGNQAFSGGGLLTRGNIGVQITRARFEDNVVVGAGGALAIGYDYSNDDAAAHEITDAAFERNRAGTDAGAVRIGRGSRTILRNVRFVANTASGAGALGVFGQDVDVVNADFFGNSASHDTGGAVNIWSPHTITLTNAVFVGNQAGAEGSRGSVLRAADGLARLTNVTLADNGPGAFFASFAPPIQVQNAVAWPVQAPFVVSGVYSSGPAEVSHAIVQGGTPGTAVSSADPQYLAAPSPGADGAWGTPDDDYGDLRLSADSPAVGAGLDAWLPPDIADLDDDGDRTERLPLDRDQHPRQRDTVDLGAYEQADGTVASEDAPQHAPGLSSAGPNPFSAQTTLALSLARPADHVAVVLYDALGRRLATLHDGPAAAGRLLLPVDAEGLPVGLYVVRASAGASSWSLPITRVR